MNSLKTTHIQQSVGDNKHLEYRTKDIEDIVKEAKYILKERNKLYNSLTSELKKDVSDEYILTEILPIIVRQLTVQFQDFVSEFPLVFSSIIYEQKFVSQAFRKYLQFRKKQPLIYFDSEQSIQDLMKYQYYVFQIEHGKNDERIKREYKNQLYKQIKEMYMQQKDDIKQISQQFLDVKKLQAEALKCGLIQNLLYFASKHADSPTKLLLQNMITEQTNQ